VIHSIPSLKNYAHDFDYEARISKNLLKWNFEQSQAILAATYPGVLLVSGCMGTGKTSLVAEIALQNLRNYPEERILIVSRCEVGISLILQSLAKSGQIFEDLLMRLGSYDQINQSKNSPEVETENFGDFTKYGRVNFMLKLRLDMLEKIGRIAHDVNPQINPTFTCETALIFNQSQLQARFTSFSQEVSRLARSEDGNQNIPDYPFSKKSITKFKQLYVRIRLFYLNFKIRMQLIG
jgi:intron-binding protein aquarius